jgi:hypothetical protein
MAVFYCVTIVINLTFDIVTHYISLIKWNFTILYVQIPSNQDKAKTFDILLLTTEYLLAPINSFQADNTRHKSNGSSVNTALGYRLDDQGSRFDSQQRLGIFLFTASRMALGPTQPPIQWVPEALSLGVKWPGHEADHSPHVEPRSNNEWSYTFTPQYTFMAWCSAKAQGQLYLYQYQIQTQSQSRF